MTKPMIKMHDVTTGEIIEREMKASELKQYEIDVLASEEKRQAESNLLATKAALLERLGITAEEAKILVS